MTLTLEELVIRLDILMISDISLQVPKWRYEQYFLPYMFTYELENHDSIKLR